MTGDPRRPDVLAALLEHSRELLMVLDGAGRLSLLSPSAERALGADRMGRRLDEVVHPDDRSDIAAIVDLGHGSATCRLSTAGGWRRVRLDVRDERSNEAIGGLVCVANEVEDHGEVAAQLIHRATHDTLTALPNRAYLLDLLAAGPERAPSGALLYVDLDGFKEVNDTSGHAAGDKVLVAVADRIRRTVRPQDTVARLGGDEFVVLAGGVSDPSIAMEVAHRVIAAVGRPVDVGGRVVSVSASVGIALSDGPCSPSLLDDADRAMYQAKHDGRNRAALYSRTLRAGDRRRVDLEVRLRAAVQTDGISVRYQPLVDVATDRIVGVDALLHLRLADGTAGSSRELVGVADETGLAVAVAAGMLDHACHQLRSWDGERGPSAPSLLSVAVSGGHLRNARCATQIAAILGMRDLPPDRLCLQIQESALVDADSATGRTLEELKAIGVRLAVDDFSGGRAGLAQLRRFGVDLLRVDPAVVGGLGHDDSDTEIVRSVVALARTLGAATVACGVTTGAQAAVVADLGVDLAQGTWYGGPAGPDAALDRP